MYVSSNSLGGLTTTTPKEFRDRKAPTMGRSRVYKQSGVGGVSQSEGQWLKGLGVEGRLGKEETTNGDTVEECLQG